MGRLLRNCRPKRGRCGRSSLRPRLLLTGFAWPRCGIVKYGTSANWAEKEVQVAVCIITDRTSPAASYYNQTLAALASFIVRLRLWSRLTQVVGGSGGRRAHGEQHAA